MPHVTVRVLQPSPRAKTYATGDPDFWFRRKQVLQVKKGA